MYEALASAMIYGGQKKEFKKQNIFYIHVQTGVAFIWFFCIVDYHVKFAMPFNLDLWGLLCPRMLLSLHDDGAAKY